MLKVKRRPGRFADPPLAWRHINHGHEPGRCFFLVYFTLLTVTSSWNWRFELGSSKLPITMGLPSWARVLALILNCRTIGSDPCPLA